MVKYWFILLVSIVSFATFSQTDVYRLGPGDSLSINVYQESDLSFVGQISQQGFIDFPLLGNIQLSGSSQKEAKDRIEKLLAESYLVKPSVAVLVTTYRPFFIYGEVRSPGSYAYQPDITIEQVIALSGGLKDRASSSQWTVQRGLKKEVFKVSRETTVHPGDVIKIHKSFF